MLKNTLINKAAVKKIAIALGHLNEKVVFVGGAVVSLYIDDPAAEDVRPTKDIDITMEIHSPGKLEALREELIERGFYQSIEDTVVCRFHFEDISVDVMSTEPVGWAPANVWFAPGYKKMISFMIDGIQIQCLSLPYFMATKFVAFYDRGIKDPRTSHDFEDIVYLINYTKGIDSLILSADPSVKAYLLDCFRDILKDSVKQEAILGNLFYEDQENRYKKIIHFLELMTNE
jgi:predicted nucleotidyltransferase